MKTAVLESIAAVLFAICIAFVPSLGFANGEAGAGCTGDTCPSYTDANGDEHCSRVGQDCTGDIGGEGCSCDVRSGSCSCDVGG